MLFVFMMLLALVTPQPQGEEVSITVDGCKIAGTLLVPESREPVDVVLIIAGSGPTDRNGNNPLAGENNSLKMLAEYFYEQGYASFRYDKRGIGESCKVKESELLFDTYVNDAVEIIKYLKKDKRFANIIVAGHSEGSLIGMEAALKEPVSRYISLCGVAYPAYKTIREQLINQGAGEGLVKRNDSITDSLRQGYTIENVPQVLAPLYRKSVQPYITSWFERNPCEIIGELDIPVLVIGGTRDLQVGPEDAEKLAECNPAAKLAVIEDMNHILKKVPVNDRALNFQTYSNPKLPLSKKLKKVLVEFLK